MTSWTAEVSALSGVATPLVVVGLGFFVNKRLKRLETQQWRNQELIRTRLGYYNDLAADLNDVLCYFTFIGDWKTVSPPEIIRRKRSLDKRFHIARPLFGPEATTAYATFMDACFKTFVTWGTDALLLTGYSRRREAYLGTWDPNWESMFAYQNDRPIDRAELIEVQTLYSAVLQALMKDIDLAEARQSYSDAPVVYNAH